MAKVKEGNTSEGEYLQLENEEFSELAPPAAEGLAMYYLDILKSTPDDSLDEMDALLDAVKRRKVGSKN